MSDIDDFFNPNKPLIRKTIAGGSTNGRVRCDEAKIASRRDDFPSSSRYAEEHRAENQQELLNVILILDSEPNEIDCF